MGLDRANRGQTGAEGLFEGLWTSKCVDRIPDKLILTVKTFERESPYQAVFSPDTNFVCLLVEDNELPLGINWGLSVFSAG